MNIIIIFIRDVYMCIFFLYQFLGLITSYNQLVDHYLLPTHFLFHSICRTHYNRNAFKSANFICRNNGIPDRLLGRRKIRRAIREE